jgi:hypothetical protein
MKYRFVFKKTGYKSETTYEKEMEYYDIPVEDIFHDACCLLDFCIFDEVRMFDETGKEYKELY